MKYLVAAVAFLPFAFSADQENIDIYILPLDANHARVKGSLSRVTTDPSIDQRPSLSIDGKKLAWETSRGGNFEVSPCGRSRCHPTRPRSRRPGCCWIFPTSG